MLGEGHVWRPFLALRAGDEEEAKFQATNMKSGLEGSDVVVSEGIGIMEMKPRF
jgi:hypothetical protein